MSFWKINIVESNVRISILDLWGISFHAVVVFGLNKDFLFIAIMTEDKLISKIHKVFYDAAEK